MPRLTTIFWLIPLLLYGCGQTGPLYLPNQPPPPPPKKVIKQTQIHPDRFSQGKEKSY